MERQQQSKQLDVHYVDRALLSILVPRVVGYLRDCAAHFPAPFSQSQPHYSSSLLLPNLDDADRSSLVQLSLSALMALVTIGRGVGTPAMTALGLSVNHVDQQQQVSGRRTTNSSGTGTDTLDRLQRVAVYIVLSGVLPSAYRLIRKRWEEDDMEDRRGEGISSPASQMERIASSRRRKVRDGVMKFIAFVVPPARLINHLLFIVRDGSVANEPSAPTLSMRLAGLSYNGDDNHDNRQTTQAQQHINYAYAYRRVLYEQAFALAMMMTPVAQQLAALPGLAMESIAQYKERMQQYFQMLIKSGDTVGADVDHGDGHSTNGDDVGGSRQCSICHANPVTIPYIGSSSCGRKEVYCYYCIRLGLLDKPNMQQPQLYRRHP